MTHKETQQLRRTRAKRDVMALLRLTEEQYNKDVFDFAYEYLKREGWNEVDFIGTVTKLKSFWHWWRNQYSIADEKFLNEVCEAGLYGAEKREVENLYRLRHVEPGVEIDKRLMDSMGREYTVKCNKVKDRKRKRVVRQKTMTIKNPVHK